MAQELNDNMRLWKQFETTDPKHTKPVEFGRKFTAIDAHWQIMRVTEVLGPVGKGWGYDVVHSVERLEDKMILAVADVTLWTAGKHDSYGIERNYYGPIRGTCEFYSPNRGGKMVVDEDAPKKAMTDALTKGLSHLGVSADVFLGLFDDNRYVQKAGQKWEAIKTENDPGLPPAIQKVLDDIRDSTDSTMLEKVLTAARAQVDGWTAPQKNLVALRSQERRTQLARAVAAE